MNFPTHSLCSGAGRPKEYRADGISITTLLPAILELMPLDLYHEWQAYPPTAPLHFLNAPRGAMAVMDMTEGDKLKHKLDEAPVVQVYRDIANKKEGVTVRVHAIERFAFYEHAKTTYAIIHTGDTTPYANVILTRGVC
ncbi:D-ribose pyranase RbsD/L-fucose mutarotase FucU [Trinorchestia longiramus]|nr:D-ribose pyranase RbsD/L-fucose mutarotase FucU [Trinorchestia longiramus]